MRMPLKAFSCCQWCSPWADKDRRSRCGSSSWLQEQSTECKLRGKQESNKRCKSKASCVWPVSGVVGGGQLQESVHSLARTLHGTAACLVACLRVAIAGQMPRKKKRFVYSVTSYAHLSFQGSPQRLRRAAARLAPVTTVLKPPKGQG